MRLENGKMVYEMHPCISCDGKGQVNEILDCPNDRMKMRGQKCPHCGTTNCHHSFISTGKMRPCGYCDGAGKKMEDRCDSIPDEMWKALKFKVYRTNQHTTFNDAYLGFGSVWSCMDYGRHMEMTDDELIAKVRDEGNYIQAIKIINEDGTICDHIGIVCKDQGYVVYGLDKERHNVQKV